ncbi:MAG: MotA/TolQ/ExbB proton channel family protein [Acidobacteria bacterium]|nr:MotA/TolQ/ExbB proton channel family protein [Acidobacteriota bacterium]
MWTNSGAIAKGVIILLLLLSIWSISVMIEKWMTYRASKKQSIEFLPVLVRCLNENKVQEAVDSTKRFKKAHIAKVVSAGLMEYMNSSVPGQKVDAAGATHRALDMAMALTSAEMKKGLGGLGTIGSTAPFIGLFGTVVGIINAFSGMAVTGSGGLAAVSAGIAEALITTAFGLLVAIPAVMAFNYFSERLERFQIEMSNASSELLDYILKKQGAVHGS